MCVDIGCDHPAIAWKRAGLLQTTGLMLPLPLASHADGALLALKALSSNSENLPSRGSALMGERARLLNIKRAGRFTANGFGKLLDTADGRVAVNIVREDDWDLIPAWLENYADDWDGIERIIRQRKTANLLERAVDIGLAVSEDTLPSRPKTWFSSQSFEKTSCDAPLIVDLSGLWAGPLASSLLGMTGAKVIKIESPMRPDGMRFGHKGFYDVINGGKDCVGLDFQNSNNLIQLKALLAKADVVIEGSRPRAFEQLGIIAEDYVARKPGKVWARLTAYGRANNRIGFGDDIGISAGLATVMEKAHHEPCFVGDAIADPISGLHLALVIKASLSKGGGQVIDLAMCDVLRYAMGDIPLNYKQTAEDWQYLAEQDNAPLHDMREPFGVSKDLCADSTTWLC